MKTFSNEQQQTNLSLRNKVSLAFFAFILIGANDGALGVLLPSLLTYYHIDKATAGLLFIAGTTGYFIAAFNNGLLVERLGNRNFLMLGTTFLLLSLGSLSLIPPFVITLIAFLFSGLGVAILDAGLNSYIASLPRNTSLLNYLHAFYGIGALLGPIIAASMLASKFSWNNVYLVSSTMSAALLVGFSLVFKDQLSTQKDMTKAENNVLLITLRQRVIWIAAFFLIFYVGSEISLGNWSYSLLTEERHGSMLLSGWIVSGYWLGLTLGRLTLAKVALKIGNKRLIQGCLIGIIIGITLAWLAPIQLVSALGLWITGFSLGPIYPTTIALMSNLVSARVLPGAIGFAASLGSVGAALFPWLAGNLAQRVGLWSLFPYIIILTVVMLCLWAALQNYSQIS